jgi:hypothetical protein
MFDGAEVNHRPGLTSNAIQALAFFRKVRHIGGQPRADNDHLQDFRSCIAKVMRVTTSRISNEITRRNLQNRSADAGRAGAFQNIDAFFLIVVRVKFAGH